MRQTTIDEAIEHLQGVGFGEYEARAYATLVDRGTLTGYGLAKESGIPRPNVYGVIDRLEKRGAITRIQVRDGVKYAALPADEMLSRVSRSLEGHLSRAKDALGGLGQAGAPEAVWNIEGYDQLISEAEELAGKATTQLLVGIWSDEARRLAPAMTAATARGVRTLVLCAEGCEPECGGCRGNVYRYAVGPGAEARSLIVIADDRELLVGQIAAGTGATAAHTTIPALVMIAAQYLRNTIAAAEIVRSAGTKLPKLLDKHATEAVQGADLAIEGRTWLQRLNAIVRRAPR